MQTTNCCRSAIIASTLNTPNERFANLKEKNIRHTHAYIRYLNQRAFLTYVYTDWKTVPNTRYLNIVFKEETFGTSSRRTEVRGISNWNWLDKSSRSHSPRRHKRCHNPVESTFVCVAGCKDRRSHYTGFLGARDLQLEDIGHPLW